MLTQQEMGYIFVHLHSPFAIMNFYHEFLLHLSYEVLVLFLNCVLGAQNFIDDLKVKDFKGL